MATNFDAHVRRSTATLVGLSGDAIATNPHYGLGSTVGFGAASAVQQYAEFHNVTVTEAKEQLLEVWAVIDGAVRSEYELE